jgi:hypothetical protein
VHTDTPAATLATQVGAHAFTTGNDIVFEELMDTRRSGSSLR